MVTTFWLNAATTTCLIWTVWYDGISRNQRVGTVAQEDLDRDLKRVIVQTDILPDGVGPGFFWTARPKDADFLREGPAALQLRVLLLSTAVLAAVWSHHQAREGRARRRRHFAFCRRPLNRLLGGAFLGNASKESHQTMSIKRSPIVERLSCQFVLRLAALRLCLTSE